MFRRNRRVRDTTPSEPAGAQRERFTYLQHGTVVTGALQASGRVRLHGTIRGDVEVEGLLEVAEDGLIEGSSVKAAALVVLGRVLADVRVPGKVEIWKDAHLEGDVWAGSLDIEEGATFKGRCDTLSRTGTPQLGAPDAVAPEAGAPDAGARDAGAPEAGERDAGAPEAGERGRPEPGAAADAPGAHQVAEGDGVASPARQGTEDDA